MHCVKANSPFQEQQYTQIKFLLTACMTQNSPQNIRVATTHFQVKILILADSQVRYVHVEVHRFGMWPNNIMKGLTIDMYQVMEIIASTSDRRGTSTLFFIMTTIRHLLISSPYWIPDSLNGLFFSAELGTCELLKCHLSWWLKQIIYNLCATINTRFWDWQPVPSIKEPIVYFWLDLKNCGLGNTLTTLDIVNYKIDIWCMVWGHWGPHMVSGTDKKATRFQGRDCWGALCSLLT